ncbi:MAG TPA: amidohydrolase family protein [Gemmatimonadaceae bacterium]|nr:amidohydrolase family protein [Gemmatimonadaceae bacterium]
MDRREALQWMAGVALGASPLGRVLGRGATRDLTRVSTTRATGRAGSAGVSGVRPAGLALAIQGGLVFTGGALRALAVGVADDGRIQLSETPLPADRVIDATGRIVAPGFIDILGDNSSKPEKSYLTYEKYKLTDGVSTALQMHGGAGDVGAYRRHFDPLPHHVNFGTSTKVMIIRNKYHDRATRLRKVEDSLDAGALGVSHSPEYQPDTTFDELVDYGRMAKRYERPLVLHLRYSSSARELDGVREAVRVVEKTGVRLHIAHLNSTGGTFHMEDALGIIRDARSRGMEITCCVYPYSYWATYVSSARFGPGWQEHFHLDYGDLTVVGTGERLTAKSFAHYRKTPGVLVAVPPGTQPLARTFDLAIREDFCMVASDGGIEREAHANSHPRGAGCFSTALRHSQDVGIPITQVLAAMTSRPASLARLDSRGEIRDGYIADLIVFDPRSVDGRATVANPDQYSAGIDAVVVNGKVSYEPGRPLGMNGSPQWARPVTMQAELVGKAG